MTSVVPSSADPATARPRGLFTSSILILSNLLPLAGLLLWGWDAFVLLCLYWLETAVIGFWTILRLVTLSRGTGPTAERSLGGSLALGGFFVLHAGIFMGVHMIFIYTLFGGPWVGRIHNARDFISLIVIGSGLWAPLLAVFAGQGAIFINDAINRYVFGHAPLHDADTGDIMGGFYKRIILMHVAIMGGALIAQAIGHIAPLIVLVLLKTAVEIRLQMKLRNTTAPVSSPAAK